MPDNVNSVREALKQAQWLYDELSLSPLEAAAKYGPDYEPATDEECLEVRRMIDTAIPLVEKIARQQFEEDCKAVCEYCEAGVVIKLFGDVWVHADGISCAAFHLRSAWEERNNERSQGNYGGEL